jgi:hypothetical protein
LNIGDLPLDLELAEGPAQPGVPGAFAAMGLPATDDRVDIRGVDLDPGPTAARGSAAITLVPLPRKQSSTRSPRAERSRIASATIATGLTVGCRAKRFALLGRAAERGGDAMMLPDIAAVAPEPAELHVVAVGSAAVPEHENEFVPAAVE